MRFLRLIAVLLIPSALFAQGVYVPARTVNSSVNGILRPVQATITVCAANIGGVPCSPALAGVLFKDNALTQPLANPTTTDANGNYPQMALGGGNYTITETAAGFTGFSYQLTVSCSPGPCTVTSLTTTGNVIVGGNLSVTGSFAPANISAGSLTVSGLLSCKNLEGVGCVDGTNSQSWAGTDVCGWINSAVAAQSATNGGKVLVFLNGLFTCATALNITSSVEVDFTPGFRITMGANQAVISNGTASGALKCTHGGEQDANGRAGCTFVYTGAASAFVFGHTTGASFSDRIYQWDIEGINVDITGANTATAAGFEFDKAFNFYLRGNQVLCNTSANSQVGFLLQGGNVFTDLMELYSQRTTFCAGGGIKTTGSVNATYIYGGEYNCGALAVSTGYLEVQASAGTNHFFAPDFESCNIGMDVANNNNRGYVRLENDTTHIKFESGATDNYIYTDITNPVLVDSSGNARNFVNSGAATASSFSGLRPTPTGGAAGHGWLSDMSVTLGGGTGRGYAMSGYCRAAAEVAGDQCIGGDFWSTAQNNGADELGARSGATDATGIIHDFDIGTPTAPTRKASIDGNGNFYLVGTIQNIAKTATQGLTLKKGSGGGNYSVTNTAYNVAGSVLDSTNLCLVVTIPTGWKLSVVTDGVLQSATAAVAQTVGLGDLGTTCSTTGSAAALAGTERTFTPPAIATFDIGFSMNTIITGDGAAHAIALMGHTSAGADALVVQNASAAAAPSMTFTLMPSN